MTVDFASTGSCNTSYVAAALHEKYEEHYLLLSQKSKRKLHMICKLT